MNSSVLRRLSALVASASLAITGLSLVAAPAQADPYLRPMNQGATWLSGQLTNGLIHNPNFGGFDDYGLSIDTALALDEVGGYDSTVAAIGTAIRNNYYNYTTPFGGPTTYAGAIAKALVLAQIAGTGPASYPSALRADLEDQTSGTAPTAGRIENVGEFEYVPPYNPTDTANVFGQALAARALVLGGSSEATAALNFLLAQQCADGGFRERFDAKDDVLQGCDPADTATYGDRIGATATAVLNLEAISGSPGVGTALSAARAWLKLQQNPDDSFGPNGGNANTTGLAARAIGDSPEAARAAGWLRNLQINDTDACTKAGGALGAVAFKAASLADYRANGVPTTDVSNGKQDELRRATAQALPALRFVDGPVAPVALHMDGPTGYVAAGKGAVYTIVYATPGSALCVSTGSSTKATTAGGNGYAGAVLTMPAGTATRTVTVTDSEGNIDTVLTPVLSAKTLTVKPAVRRVKQGKSVKVTVSGLAAGESVRLRYRGEVVAWGWATSTGTFVRTIRVGRKLGLATVAAAGQFWKIRKGSTTIRVIR